MRLEDFEEAKKPQQARKLQGVLFLFFVSCCFCFFVSCSFGAGEFSTRGEDARMSPQVLAVARFGSELETLMTTDLQEEARARAAVVISIIDAFNFFFHLRVVPYQKLRYPKRDDH